MGIIKREGHLYLIYPLYLRYNDKQKQCAVVNLITVIYTLRHIFDRKNVANDSGYQFSYAGQYTISDASQNVNYAIDNTSVQISR